MIRAAASLVASCN